MSLADAFAVSDAVYREQVKDATWGHLAPEPARKYEGYIYFAETAWGQQEPIEAVFDGLDDSPWFFDDLCAFISKGERKTGVYKFNGYYQRFKNGGHRFVGKTIRVLGMPVQRVPPSKERPETMSDRCEARGKRNGMKVRCSREKDHTEKNHRWTCTSACPHTQCAADRLKWPRPTQGPDK